MLILDSLLYLFYKLRFNTFKQLKYLNKIIFKKIKEIIFQICNSNKLTN